MYAIIRDGSRQYKVVVGQQITVDYRDVKPGEAIEFGQVVAASDGESLKLGKPTVKGATVSGKVVGPMFGPKLVIQKFRRRKTFRRRTGHRQLSTNVVIDKISL